MGNSPAIAPIQEAENHTKTAQTPRPLPPVATPLPLPPNADAAALISQASMALAHSNEKMPKMVAATPFAPRPSMAAPSAAPDQQGQPTPDVLEPNNLILPASRQQEVLYDLAGMIKDYQAIGKTPQDAAQAARTNYQALSTTLAPYGNLAKHATSILTHELNKQLALSDCHVPEEVQQYSIVSLFTKRQAEAKAAADWVLKPEVLQTATQLAAEGRVLPHLYWLTEAKKAEIIADMGDNNAPHTVANALGQHLLHKALAAMFKLDGPLEPHLVAALHEANPNLSPQEARGLAQNWLHIRFHRAQAVTDLTKPANGALANQALQTAADDVAQKYGIQAPQTLAERLNSSLHAHHHPEPPILAATFPTAKTSMETVVTLTPDRSTVANSVNYAGPVSQAATLTKN